MVLGDVNMRHWKIETRIAVTMTSTQSTSPGPNMSIALLGTRRNLVVWKTLSTSLGIKTMRMPGPFHESIRYLEPRRDIVTLGR